MLSACVSVLGHVSTLRDKQGQMSVYLANKVHFVSIILLMILRLNPTYIYQYYISLHTIECPS